MRRVRFERRLHLMRVEVENLLGFRQVALDLGDAAGRPRPAVVALGEAGSGKTSLLRVMALGLTPPRDARALIATAPGIWPGETPGQQREGRGEQGRGKQREGRVRVELCDPGAPAERLAITTSITTDPAGQVSVRQETEPAQGFPWHRVLACGYGAQRGPATGRALGHAPRTAVASLFRRDARVLAPAALGARLATAAWGHARAILGDAALGAPGDLDALGDSAFSLLSWLVDLLGHAHAAGALDAQARPAGIALVDAIDAHLHPAAQRQLLDRLARRFPALQLVVTAQSPGIVVNRAAGDVIVCRRRGRARAVAQGLPPLAGRNADEILRGPWFGLPATVDDHTARLLARYREAVASGAGEEARAGLREAVRGRVGYFVATPLDELAAEVVAALASELDQPDRSGEARQAVVEEAMRRLRRRLDRT
jgi:hypothetical protein